MKKIIYTLLLALTSLFAQAQVKIGSNPGTIGSTSNLEVEATNGAKVMVDKTTGNMGDNTSTPGNKLEVNSGTTNSSGVRLTNLKESSSVSTTATATLGVDSNGDVVVVSKNTVNGASCVPDYAFVTGGSAYSNVSEGSDVVLNALPVANGITIVSPGIFKLRAGNTYRLEAALFIAYNQTLAVAMSYRWYSASTNTVLPIQNTPRANTISGNAEGTQPLSVAIYTPTVDDNVVLRITNAQSIGGAYFGNHSYLSITQLNPCK